MIMVTYTARFLGNDHPRSMKCLGKLQAENHIIYEFVLSSLSNSGVNGTAHSLISDTNPEGISWGMGLRIA